MPDEADVQGGKVELGIQHLVAFGLDQVGNLAAEQEGQCQKQHNEYAYDNGGNLKNFLHTLSF